MKNFYKDKNILITGSAGTIGCRLTEELLTHEVNELRLLDNNETELFFLMEKYSKSPDINCFLGDIRDKDKLKNVMDGIDIVFHIAAFKHVLLSESNPFDVIQTNVFGVQNVIKAAMENNVKNVLFTSSDKAVNPTNVMGTTKLLGEKLMTAANAVNFNGDTIFSSTRFGNVIGSKGSVVPVFMRQIKKGGPVTLTDERMTRFVMTAKESVMLVLKSAIMSKGGEVFVTKMPVVRISDLANVMIEILAPKYGYNPSDIEIIKAGSKAGEKLYEELLTEEEVSRSMELKDMFVVTPGFKSIYHSINYEYPDTVSKEIQQSYVSFSEQPLDSETLKQYLIDNRVIDDCEV